MTAAAAALATGCGAWPGGPENRQAGGARVCSTTAPPGAFRPDPALFAPKRPPEAFCQKHPRFLPNGLPSDLAFQVPTPFANDTAQQMPELTDKLL